jgi:hypothetical protein
MSAAAAVAKKFEVSFGQVYVMGRVEAVRRHDGRVYTRVLQPASDAFSRPASNEIISKSSIGAVGEVVTVLCRLEGYTKKPFSVTDQNTGEVRRVVQCENLLVAVE